MFLAVLLLLLFKICPLCFYLSYYFSCLRYVHCVSIVLLLLLFKICPLCFYLSYYFSCLRYVHCVSIVLLLLLFKICPLCFYLSYYFSCLRYVHCVSSCLTTSRHSNVLLLFVNLFVHIKAYQFRFIILLTLR